LLSTIFLSHRVSSEGVDGTLWSYLWLFLSLLGGSVGLPIPEDIPLLYAGVMLGKGDYSLLPAFLVSYTAVIIGDLIIFFVGRQCGDALYRSRFFRHKVTPQKVELLKARLERHSILVIITARHLFYLRSLTFLGCGLLKMTFRRFIAIDAIGACMSISIMLLIGYTMSDQLTVVWMWFARAKTFSLFLAATLMIALLIGYLRTQSIKDR
jgi:membrane protein DedA with SNARE-associated domain